MKRKLHNLAVFTVLALIISVPAVSHADVVSDWNAIGVQSTITGARPGPTGVIDLAIMHAAIYDAVQAIERRYEPYYIEVSGANGSPVAAAARAARDVLVGRFPAQTSSLDTQYQQYLLTHGIPDTDPGLMVGARAAAGILAMRSCDGSFPTIAPPPFLGGTGIGVWRPTPPANQAMQAPWLGNVTPFLMTRPSQFRADPPPAVGSRRYARDYNEVKLLGSLNGSTRSPEQTDVAHFFAGNTFVIWNRALRDISNAHVNDIADSSRLFAMADLAVADALITAWSDKIHYVFWRPITAIHEGENDGNPWTSGDTMWQPLITTPNYPEYSSGAVNFATAMTRSLELFFRTDRMTFSVTTTNTLPTVQDTRTYERFSDAADDVVDARVFSGIHFRFGDEAARKQGRQIAAWGHRYYFRPLGGNGDDDDDLNVQ